MVIPKIIKGENHTIYRYECYLVATYSNHYNDLPSISVCFVQDIDANRKIPPEKIFMVNKESNFYKHAMSISHIGAKLIKLGITE
jgi:hypothetical protein